MAFMYISYENKHAKSVDDYIELTASSYTRETLHSLHLAEYLKEKNQELFFRINQEAKDRLEKNNDLSLVTLKEELTKKYNLTDIEFELYMVNKDYTIYDTTFAPDLGFDLSFSTDTASYIEQCNENEKGIYFVKGVVYDSLDKQYKIYTYTKIKKDTYLEMGFIDKRLNGFHLYEFHRNSKYVDSKSDLHIVTTLDKSQNYFSLGTKEKHTKKSNKIKSMNMFNIGEKTDNLIINAVREKKEIRVQNGKYIYIYKPILSHKDLEILRDGDIVLEIIIDISEQQDEFEQAQLIFFLLSLVALVLFIVVFIWTKSYISGPTKNIVQSMSDLSLIEDEALLTKKDEFGTISKEYNKLVLRIHQEIELNKTLLLENKKFVSNTVHQIRTPLSTIMLNSDLIKMAQIDDSSEEYINQINASINMLSNSYEDLLYISSHTTVEYKKISLSLSEILQSRIDFFEDIAELNDKTILVMIEYGITLHMNQIELERLIDNNISNAIKYAEVNQPITIELEKDADEIRLSFYSYAEAIKNVSLIFEKNHQENKDTQGLGLGLNMVKGICEKYSITYEVKYQNNQNIFTYIFKA